MAPRGTGVATGRRGSETVFCPGDGGAPQLTRIVHVASGREYRGGQHQVLLLARGMHRAGADTIVLTGSGTELARRLQDAGVPVDPVGWTIGVDPRVAIRLGAALAPGTIVHAHDSHAHVLADAAARIRHVPVVVTRRVEFPIRTAARYRRADAAVAVSSAVRRQLLDAGVDPVRIHVVPDAIDSDDLEPYGSDPAAEIPGPVDVPHIVCIAALTREKGIDTLLEAAAILRTVNAGVRWTVVGEGPERRALEHRRTRLGLDDVVGLPGARRDIGAVIRHATLVVQPSRHEGLGTAVLQALAHGIPVVASRAGGLPDALMHGGGVLVPPDAPMELSSAIGRLLDDAVERARLGTQGRIAATHFTLDLLVERMVGVYRSIEQLPGDR